MREITINSKTKLYAILGEPISHSLSPVIMNTEFDRRGMDCAFVALKSNKETIDTAMKALRDFGLSGYVFTMPVKETAVTYMDELKAEAEIIEAVNCAKLENGKLIGYNTDSLGFYEAIMHGNPNKKKITKAFVMGMGGFAKAAVTQLALQGVNEIIVANRLSETEYVASFDAFSKRLKRHVPNIRLSYVDWKPELWTDALYGADVIANGTSNGMYGKGDLAEIFPFEATSKYAIVFDAVYAPLETAFIKKASELGHPVVDGLWLLVHQGLCSFRIWTGITVEAEEMRKNALDFLRENGKDK